MNNQIQAAIDQYVKTILELQTRVANAAAELQGAAERIKQLEEEVSMLKPKEKKDENPAADLHAVP